MSDYLEVADVTLFRDAPADQVQAVIDDAEVMLRAEIPRLDQILEKDRALVKAVLRQAVIRWLDAGDGAVVTQSAPGGYSQTIDSSRQRRGFFFDDELNRIRNVIPTDPETPDPALAGKGRAFTVDMLTGTWSRHEDGCSVYFGGLCSCGLWFGPWTNTVLPGAPEQPIVAGEEP